MTMNKDFGWERRVREQGFGFRSKVATRCEACGKEIAAGDVIMWTRGNPKRRHASCGQKSTQVDENSTQVENPAGWTHVDGGAGN